MPAHEDSRDLTIPGWVPKLVAFYLFLTIPWMGWVTVKLASIDVQVSVSAESQAWRLAEIERRVTRLEAGK